MYNLSFVFVTESAFVVAACAYRASCACHSRCCLASNSRDLLLSVGFVRSRRRLKSSTIRFLAHFRDENCQSPTGTLCSRESLGIEPEAHAQRKACAAFRMYKSRDLKYVDVTTLPRLIMIYRYRYSECRARPNHSVELLLLTNGSGLSVAGNHLQQEKCR